MDSQPLDALSKVLDGELDTAQTELEGAEIALLEASARAEKARGAVARLKAAVAALSGESAPAEPPKQCGIEQRPARDAHNVEAGGSNPSPATNTPSPTDTEEDIDEWERQRKKKLRQREKEREAENLANNPLAQIKCTGCGRAGHLQQTMIQAPSGIPLQCIVCSSCGNQTFS